MLTSLEAEVIDAYLDSETTGVLERFALIRAAFGSDENFRTEMLKIETQRQSDEKRYGGYMPKTFRMAGGLEQEVTSNLVSRLGLNDRFPARPDNVIVLKRAMNRSQDFKTFIRSILVGAGNHRKCWRDSDLYRALADSF